MTAGKRITRKHKVRDWLVNHGPATLPTIAANTVLSAAAVSRALQDIRNDPTMEYATVPTSHDGFKYQIAYTVDHMRAGMENQAKHMLTRAESAITAGEKMTAIAATPDEYALAADIKANGKLMKAQAQAILSALKPPPASAVSGGTP